MVQVVQPLVWPGVSRAVSTVPPSETLSPSCSTRSTFVGRYDSRVAVGEVRLASRFDHGHIRIHHHVHCAGPLLDHRAPGVVIPVRGWLARDVVLELEPEFLDTGLNHWHVGFHVAVDKDVSLRCRDQIVGQSLTPDVVQVPCDVKWGKRFGPAWDWPGQPGYR